MARQVVDYADARNMMVDGQVRPNKVTDPRILDAMRRLPRERFLPDALAARAYADEDVKLPGGRALMEPMVIARLVQMLGPRTGERALVIAAGSGYGTALLAACGARVTALEDDAMLLGLARAALPEFAAGATIVEGVYPQAAIGDGPFDVVLIEGAVDAVPPSLAALLRRPGGRLATVLLDGNAVGARIGRAILGEPVAGGADGPALRFQPVFDCATPLLPQFARKAGFAF